MKSEYCRMECRWAKRYKLKVVGVVEQAENHGAANFADEIKAAPAGRPERHFRRH